MNISNILYLGAFFAPQICLFGEINIFQVIRKGHLIVMRDYIPPELLK